MLRKITESIRYSLELSSLEFLHLPSQVLENSCSLDFIFFYTWKSLILSGNSLVFSDSTVACCTSVIIRVFISASHKWEVCSLKNSWRTCVSALVGLARSMWEGRAQGGLSLGLELVFSCLQCT